MRLALLAIVGLSRLAAADPEGHGDERLAAFAAQWPKLAAATSDAEMTKLLQQGQPCADPADPKPPISDVTPSSLSPDGKTLVEVATLQLDPAAAKRLGAPAGVGLVMLVLDGPSGAIWARPLMAFRDCNPNGYGFTWSTDSRRVVFDTDTGHGLRVALVGLDARALRFEAFTGPTMTASPGVQHVAWIPWFSGFPFADQAVPDGDELRIEDLVVWGSIKPGAATIWDLAWTSDAELTFCGKTPKLAAARYAASVRGKRVIVKRVADCVEPP